MLIYSRYGPRTALIHTRYNFFISLLICHEQKDESSSALDAQAEQDLLLSLRRLLESDDNNLSAVLFITHKNSVINACDRSITLSEGRITGS